MIDANRLVATFLDLVAIDSPSGAEEAIGAHLAQRLAELGGAVERDEHGNLIARWPGELDDGEWLLLSAHMDTVGKDTGIAPVIRDGVIYSDGATILGSDDKSGVAIILEVVQSLREDGRRHSSLEAAITVGEEVGLLGARLLDVGKLRARQGYVLDTDGPIGTIVTSAPGQDSLEARIHGRKAHAGAEPERGINAIRVAAEAIASMPLGRIDAETTANIGVIQGGEATNIVPDQVTIRGEARSRDDGKLAAQTAAMAAALRDAAERHGARVDLKIKRAYTAYRLPESHRVVARAVDAARRLDLEPLIVATGGGSDANIYAERGIPCVVLSTGMADVHTPREHIAIADMVDAARLLEAIASAAGG